jgi:hypothetical protein
MQPSVERLAASQGAYYLATGVWPLVSLRSFEAVTGPKLEGWLVETVGALVSCVGSTLLLAARRKRVTPELALLGAGSALALAAIETIYVARRRIAPIYLLDAVLEVGLAAGWARAALRRGRSRGVRRVASSGAAA